MGLSIRALKPDSLDPDSMWSRVSSTRHPDYAHCTAWLDLTHCLCHTAKHSARIRIEAVWRQKWSILIRNICRILPVKLRRYITLLWFYGAINLYWCVLPLSEVHLIATPKTVVLGLGDSVSRSTVTHKMWKLGQNGPFFKKKKAPFWNLISKKENNYIFQKKSILTIQKRQNFALWHYILPKQGKQGHTVDPFGSP